MLNVEQLAGYAFFKGLSDLELEAVASCLVKRYFVKDAYLFFPGNPSLNLYLVESGVIRLFFNNTRGEEFLFGLMGPRAVFGHPLQLEGSANRLLGAAALTPSVVLSLSYEDLFELTKKSNQLSLNLYQDLASIMRKITLHYQSIIMTGVEGRTASLLLHMGESREDHFHLPISQTDLASWLGVSRGRLNQTLNKFQKNGYIQFDGSNLTILDRAGLSTLTDGNEFLGDL